MLKKLSYRKKKNSAGRRQKLIQISDSLCRVSLHTNVRRRLTGVQEQEQKARKRNILSLLPKHLHLFHKTQLQNVLIFPYCDDLWKTLPISTIPQFCFLQTVKRFHKTYLHQCHWWKVFFWIPLKALHI